jgi:1-acyl-sn-glycerol-3-phosphate acyltransferase
MSNLDRSNSQFFPPQQNYLITRLCQSVFGLVTYWVYQLELVIDDRDLAQLKAIKDQRVVYLPNHSTLNDGVVVFLLSARIRQLFHYVVAYEAFQGVMGKLLQKVGAYSIRRGVGDRSSIVQTLKLLQQPACKLLIFPEGGCSYQNDTVMPFRPGAIELSFKAIARLVKQEATVPDFYLVPVSLKYRYPGSMDSEFTKTLNSLETALSIQPATNDSYQRLRAIGERVLINLETEYDLKYGLNSAIPETDWNERINRLKTHLLNYCETKLDLAQSTQVAPRERVYKIQSILASNQPRSPKLSTATYNHLYKTTVRLLNFDAIYDGYVASKPTPERFFDTLDRLEREIFQVDRPKSKGHRQVFVKTGTPINLKEYWQSYQSDSETTIKTLTEQIQQTVQKNLGHFLKIKYQ